MCPVRFFSRQSFRQKSANAHWKCLSDNSNILPHPITKAGKQSGFVSSSSYPVRPLKRLWTCLSASSFAGPGFLVSKERVKPFCAISSGFLVVFSFFGLSFLGLKAFAL